MIARQLSDPIEVDVRIKPTLRAPGTAAFQGAIRSVHVVHDMDSPLQFQIEVDETGDGQHTWVDHHDLQPGTNVEIKLGRLGGTATAASGEITAVAASFDIAGPTSVTITGYDPAHRLLRGTSRRGYVNQDYTAIARQVVQSAGLRFSGDKSGVEATFAAQDNETDWRFLKRLAETVDFDCYSNNDQIEFRKRRATRRADHSLVLGEQLVSFSGRVNTVRLASEVTVTGWDPAKKEEFSARARAETAPVGQGRGASKAASKWFGAATVQLDEPVVDPQHAEALVRRELDARSMDLVTGEAVVHGNAELRVGGSVELVGVGERFGGTYLIRKVAHIASAATGFRTTLDVARNRIR